MKLLIDCDYIVYKCCASAETEIDFGDDVILVTSLFSEAMKCVERELKKLRYIPFMMILFSFLQVLIILGKKLLPEYKGHRNEKSPVDLNVSYRN